MDKHKHGRTEHYSMKGSKKEMEDLAARFNLDPRAPDQITTISGNTMTMTCLVCERPIAIIALEFTEE